MQGYGFLFSEYRAPKRQRIEKRNPYSRMQTSIAATVVG